MWLGLGSLCVVVAAALAAVELLPALEAMTQATRGGGVPSGWDWTLTVRFLVNLVGAPLGAPSWEDGGGLGVLWLALASLAPLLYGGLVRYRAAIAVVLILFSLGGGAALQVLPGFGLFQIHSRMLILLAVPVSLLAAVSVQALCGAKGRELAAHRLRGAVLRVLLVALVLLGARVVLFKTGEIRFPLYWLTLLFTLPVASWLLGKRGTENQPCSWPAWIWGVVLAADVLALAWPLIEVRPESASHEPSECVRYVWAHAQAGERVLDRGLVEAASSPLDPGLPMILRIESLRGFNSVDVRRYKEYLLFIMDDDRPLRPRQGIFGFPILDNFPIRNKPLLDLLGVRFLLQPAKPPWAEPPWNIAGPGEPGEDETWQCVFEEKRPQAYQVIAGGVRDLPAYRVYQNRAAIPRAFIVPEAAPIPEGGQVLPALKAADFRRTVLLEGHPGGSPGASSTVSHRLVTVREYLPNRVVLDVPSGPAGYLVLTDVWFPGWRCHIDGSPATVYRANHLFRAVELPEAASEVVFTLAPASYTWGKTVSLIALALVAFGSLLRIRLVRRNAPRIP